MIGTSRASRLGSSHVDDGNGVCNVWMFRRKVVARVGGFRVNVSSRKGGHSELLKRNTRLHRGVD